ncbi:MAG: hypothetical protein ACRDM1_16470, partial [Gaiellaceae bacterium]
MAKAADEASGYTGSASSEMDQSEGDLVDSHAGSAANNQAKAGHDLGSAIDTLKKALDANGAEHPKDANGMSTPQGQLAGQAGDLANKVGQLAAAIQAADPNAQGQGGQQGGQ